MEYNEKAKLVIDDKLSSPSFFYFLSLAYSFICNGLSFSITGPTLPNIKSQINVTINILSYMFLFRNIGDVLGSIFAGGIIDKYAHYGKTLLCLSVCLMGITTALIPTIYSLPLFFFLQSIFGIAKGMTESFAQVLLLKECNKHTIGPYLHGLHFSYCK
jgi:MFS family permease